VIAPSLPVIETPRLLLRPPAEWFARRGRR
jgi:hypothetical protein